MNKSKNYRLAHKEKINAVKRIWRTKNRHKTRAHEIVAKAVRDGFLTKPKKCECCPTVGEKLHAHHADYSKPLSVIWLCNPCHSKLHGVKKSVNKNYASGERHGSAKLNAEQVAEIRLRATYGETLRGLGKAFGVSGTLIHFICKGKIWANV